MELETVQEKMRFHCEYYFIDYKDTFQCVCTTGSIDTRFQFSLCSRHKVVSWVIGSEDVFGQ